MKKLLITLAVLGMAACSLAPKQEGGMDNVTDYNTTPSVQQDKTEVSEREVETGAPAKTTPPAASQYSVLNEAIKAQSDDRIYSAATQILAQSHNDVRALNALAMYQYKKGRYDLATFLLNKAIANNGRMSELFSNLGVVQMAKNENREAIKSFRKALQLNSRDVVAGANLGAIYVQEKDFNKALVVLETVYKRGFKDPRALNNYAIALTAAGKYSKAEDIYEKILKEQADNREFLFNYAVLLVDHMGKYQEGLDVVNRLKFVGGPGDTRDRIIALENKAKTGVK